MQRDRDDKSTTGGTRVKRDTGGTVTKHATENIESTINNGDDGEQKIPGLIGGVRDTCCFYSRVNIAAGHRCWLRLARYI